MTLFGAFYCSFFLSTTWILQSDGCIFGSDINCFYGCRCHFTECNIRDPDCEICDSLTGQCPLQQDACEFDDFTSSLYETRYWNGEACQKGNIAKGKLYSIEGLFEFPPANGGATDGTFTFAVSAFISPFSHTIIVDLEGDHVVEFIDLFLKFELTIAELNENVALRLESQNGSRLPCLLAQPSEENQLQNNTGNLEEDQTRMHFLCESPSIGHQFKLETLETDGVNIPVTVYEVVIIGYKYANIDLDKCMHIEGDSEIRWCTQCDNTKPPECRIQCNEGYTGLNCVNETKTLDGQAKTSSWVIPVAVIVSVAAVIFIVIIVACILYRKQIQKKNQTSTDLEETYDEIDDLGIKQDTFNTRKVSNEYLHAAQVRDPKDLADDYITSSFIENQLYQSEGCLIEMEKQNKQNEHIPLEMTTNEGLENPFVDTKTIKDDYLTSASVENHLHQEEKHPTEQGSEAKQTEVVKDTQENLTTEENGTASQDKHVNRLCDYGSNDYVCEKTSDTSNHNPVEAKVDSCASSDTGEQKIVLQNLAPDVKAPRSPQPKIEDLPCHFFSEDSLKCTSTDSLDQMKTMTCRSEEENPYLISKESIALKQEKESLDENKDNQVTEPEDKTNMMVTDDVNKQATEHMPHGQIPHVEVNDVECMKSGDDPYLTPLGVKPKECKDTRSTELKYLSRESENDL